MKQMLALALMVAAVGTPANAADRGDILLRSVVLNSHNQARQSFGVSPLAWSDELAGDALRHAQYMAGTGIYGHDQTPGRRKKQGENIWRGERGQFSYEVMVGGMIAESRNFKPGTYPGVSRTGNWYDVSHYTQVVWPTTTAVGCALAASATTDYFVCRYSPTGNKDGVILASGPAPGSTELAERRD